MAARCADRLLRENTLHHGRQFGPGAVETLGCADVQKVARGLVGVAAAAFGQAGKDLPFQG